MTTLAPGRPAGPSVAGRLTRDRALGFLERGNELLASGDFAEAGRLFLARRRVRRPGDHRGRAARPRRGALPAQRRAGRASRPGQAVLQLPETPSTYPAWRNIAAARVRDGDLTGAIDAYREADRRAPREDKAEIANRLGWLTKETGDTRAVGALLRQGSRRRAARHGDAAAHRGDDHRLADRDALDRRAPRPLRAAAARQGWRSRRGSTGGCGRSPCSTADRPAPPRSSTCTPCSSSGTIVERWYGSIRFLAFYLACAAAGSTASFVFGGDVPSVGASGAIFGLFGILLAAGRIHHPVDRQSRGDRQPADGPRRHQHRVRVRVGRLDRQRRPPRRAGGRAVARRARPTDRRADAVVAVATARRDDRRPPAGRPRRATSCGLGLVGRRGRRRGRRSRSGPANARAGRPTSPALARAAPHDG